MNSLNVAWWRWRRTHAVHFMEPKQEVHSNAAMFVSCGMADTHVLHMSVDILPYVGTRNVNVTGVYIHYGSIHWRLPKPWFTVVKKHVHFYKGNPIKLQPYPTVKQMK